jgi:hypothetical protein
MSPRPHPEAERSLHAPPQSFDLAAEVSRLREERLGKRRVGKTLSRCAQGRELSSARIGPELGSFLPLLRSTFHVRRRTS